MLKDKSQSQEFRSSELWKSPLLDFKIWVPGLKKNGKEQYTSNSLSGNERNRLMLGGKDGFTQRSLVSGVDCKEDARSFTLLDFDQDGWLDFALASTNGQRLRFFRNRCGDLGASGRVVEISLEGSQTSATGQVGKSNRDAIGALITAVSNHRKRIFRKSIGEGLAAQNSGKIRVTLAEGETLKSLSVRWPSGKITTLDTSLEKPQLSIKE
ncbi:MAG: ASPIC/UnbV domain-containing protein [Verrucomicrobiaceae bacterium]|nr:ASPIC/UnbV domain-containing protein [Verrucomicrobiaceae bacterium]